MSARLLVGVVAHDGKPRHGRVDSALEPPERSRDLVERTVQPVQLAELEGKLRDIFETRKEKTMFIVGDPTLRYGDIVNVIDAAKGAGVDKVGIVTLGMREEATGQRPSGQ